MIEGIILSMLPIAELRGGIPLAIASGATPFAAFISCVIANIIIVPIIFLFLDYVHNHLTKKKFYNNLFERHIHSSRKKLEKRVGTKWEFVTLFLLVAIPFPFTGAYTGTLLSWFFKINRKKSYLSIVLGVITAGVIVTLASIGVVSLF